APEVDPVAIGIEKRDVAFIAPAEELELRAAEDVLRRERELGGRAIAGLDDRVALRVIVIDALQPPVAGVVQSELGIDRRQETGRPSVRIHLDQTPAFLVSDDVLARS